MKIGIRGVFWVGVSAECGIGALEDAAVYSRVTIAGSPVHGRLPTSYVVDAR